MEALPKFRTRQLESSLRIGRSVGRLRFVAASSNVQERRFLEREPLDGAVHAATIHDEPSPATW